MLEHIRICRHNSSVNGLVPRFFFSTPTHKSVGVRVLSRLPKGARSTSNLRFYRLWYTTQWCSYHWGRGGTCLLSIRPDFPMTLNQLMTGTHHPSNSQVFWDMGMKPGIPRSTRNNLRRHKIQDFMGSILPDLPTCTLHTRNTFQQHLHCLSSHHQID